MFNHSIRSGTLFGYGINSWTVAEEKQEGGTETECKALKMHVFDLGISYFSCLQNMYL